MINPHTELLDFQTGNNIDNLYHYFIVHICMIFEALNEMLSQIFYYSLDFIDGKTEYKWSQSSHSLYALDHRVTFFLGEKIVRLFCSKKKIVD